MAYREMGVPAPVGQDDGKRSPDGVRLLWTELLARLTHVADVLSRPEVAAQLRALGVRSANAALRSLAREYAKAGQIALTTGAPPRPHEIMNRALGLAVGGDLRQDLVELAEGYRRLIQALALPAHCNRHRWLEGRALLHVAQAHALERQH